MVKLTEYEIARQKRVEENRKRVEDLFGGVDPTTLFPNATTDTKSQKNGASKKRKAQDEAADANFDANAVGEEGERQGEEDGRPQKAARQQNDSAPESGNIRRSSRLSGKKIDYNAEQDRSVRTAAVSTRGKRTMGSDPRYENKRVHSPKQYGHIPGVQVGEWWETREACSTAAIHAPWVAGISAGPKGAYSVALSGGYDDDIDLGYGFTYTGSGGRDLKGTKEKPKNLRTAPQSSDQTFENNYNRSLQRSCETKKPIRVIRGYKLKSPFAPAEGYRYDGLYTVEKAWIEPGNNSKGYKVCKYTFKRLPDQPPLPRREVEEETGSEDRNNEDDDATACDQDDASSKDVDAEGSEEDEQ